MLFSNELAWSAPADAEYIDLTHEADLSYWTQTLACNSHELVDAVQRVGISVADIAAHLKRGSASAKSR